MDPSDSDPEIATPLSAGNAPYVESLYAAYVRDPSGIAAPWRRYFDALGAPAAAPAPAGLTAATAVDSPGAASEKQGAVSRLLQTTSWA